MRHIRPVLERWRTSSELPLLLTTHRGKAAALLDRFTAGRPRRAVGLASLTSAGLIEGVGLDDIMPAASTIKIAIVAAAIQAGKDGSLDLGKVLQAGQLAESKWPSILDCLGVERDVTLRDLCCLAIVSSDNMASDTLVQALGIERIMQWLQAVPCSDRTQLRSGFTDAAIEQNGRLNTISARDAVRILQAILADPSYDLLLLALVNNVRNQRIPRFFDDDIIVAHKTGSLNGVVNDIGIVMAPTHAFILTVFSDGQDDTDRTEGEIARLAADLVALNAPPTGA